MTNLNDFKGSTLVVPWGTTAVAGDCLQWTWAPSVYNDGTHLEATFTDAMPTDCRMLIVSESCWQFLVGVFPFLTVSHSMPGGHASRARFTRLLPEPYARSIALRSLTWKCDQDGPSVMCLRLKPETYAMVWAELRHQCGEETAPTTVKELNATIKKVRDASMATALQVSQPNDIFDAQLPGVVRAGVIADTVEGFEDENARNDTAFDRAQNFENISVATICGANGEMEPVADFLDFVGPCDVNEKRIEVSGVFQSVVGMVLEIARNEQTVRAREGSAMTLMLDRKGETALDAAVVILRRALRKQDVRSYELRDEKRLYELSAMLDLGSSNERVREAAFIYVLPAMVKHYGPLKAFFGDEPNTGKMFETFKEMCKLFLPETTAAEMITVAQLSKVIASPMKKLENVKDKLELRDATAKMSWLLTMKKSTEEAMRAAPVTAEKAAETVDDGRGRAFTKQEVREFDQLQAHQLWGKFARLVTKLRAEGGKDMDFVQAQLVSGIPVVRKQLFCEVKAGSHSIMTFLRSFRMARKKDVTIIQQYVGSAMTRGEIVPMALTGFMASVTLCEQLVAGRVSMINFECAVADLRAALGEPIRKRDVDSFTDLNRYSNLKYIDDVIDLGTKILKAWGWEGSSEMTTQELGVVGNPASFNLLLRRHKSELRLADTLADAPRENRLGNKSYGAFPILLRAMTDAEQNYIRFHDTSPAQIMPESDENEDHTTGVTCKLIPFIPDNSKYFEMVKVADHMRKDMVARSQEVPYLYNASLAEAAGVISGTTETQAASLTGEFLAVMHTEMG